MRCGKFVGAARCQMIAQTHYVYCPVHMAQAAAAGVILNNLYDPSDPPTTTWETLTGTNIFGLGPFTTPTAPTAPPMPQEKKKTPPTVDAETIARVICQLDLSKDKRAELASEFAEGLVELKAKFNRDNFIGYVKEYSK